eukprot:8978826-Pyramimonas_sp.AAC.1
MELQLDAHTDHAYMYTGICWARGARSPNIAHGAPQGALCIHKHPQDGIHGIASDTRPRCPKHRAVVASCSS